MNSETAKDTERRFVIGIDLGTTNCAVAYIDTDDESWPVQHFNIAQLVAPGEVERRKTLPSFHYEPPAAESNDGQLDLPWTKKTRPWAVGVYARELGRTVAGRMVESAKSWLCHSGVDRRAALLPWRGADDVEALSPVDVSSRYLQHIRDAWDHEFADHPFAQQDVIVTIPASFDEVARELTVAAARKAGIPRIILIEEPQAAFYSWVDRHRHDWEEHVEAGQKILVCDIGGGTTDFTLINVHGSDDGTVQFHRVAVGDHLMLGGDNLDLALAYHAERELVGEGKLTPNQWSVLIPACRHAKETLLADDGPDEHTIVLPGSGSKLIGSGSQVIVTRNDVQALLTDGFLPQVSLQDKPQNLQSGFQEFGLPYAPDAAMTRYLASFLSAHQSAEDTPSGIHPARPDIIMLNGGFFESPVLRERLMSVLQSWFSSDDQPWSPQVLRNDQLDLAVAHGAAFFGMVRRGVGVRIVAGLARTYYVGVESEAGERSVLCLVPSGTESSAGTIEIEREFNVQTSEPVEFPIYYSGTRLTDKAGEVIPFEEEQLTPLPPIRTVLQTRSKDGNERIRARLSARMTEIGTLELWCHQVDGSKRWQLQFDVRSSTETDRAHHAGTAEQAGIVDEEIQQTVRQILDGVYSATGNEKPDAVAKVIAKQLSQSRADWPPSLLRSIWSDLLDLQEGRRKGAKHEARWLNLIGFSLRPGFGMAADDWRVEETWKATRGKLVHGTPNCMTEWRILCRRIAGGLSAGRQKELSSGVLAAIRQKHRQVKSGRGKGGDYASSQHEAAEIWRMLASLELLDLRTRIELGNIICDFLPRPAFEPIRPALVWSLGRIGAREPFYGPLNSVASPDNVSTWIRSLLKNADVSDGTVQLALTLMSRRTNDRFRDIDDSLRGTVAGELANANAQEDHLELVKQGGELNADETHLVFGESLPAGLRL